MISRIAIVVLNIDSCHKFQAYTYNLFTQRSKYHKRSLQRQVSDEVFLEDARMKERKKCKKRAITGLSAPNGSRDIPLESQQFEQDGRRHFAEL